MTPKVVKSADPAEASTLPPGLTPATQWEDGFNVETVQAAYDHARETQRALDGAVEVLDRKVVAVFGISSAIAALAPAIIKDLTVGSLSSLLLIGGSVAWLFSAIYSWKAFKPRKYDMDPNPRALVSREWLHLPPGPYHLARLNRVATAVESNQQTVTNKGAALTRAFGWALIEVGFLLAALLTRSL